MERSTDEYMAIAGWVIIGIFLAVWLIWRACEKLKMIKQKPHFITIVLIGLLVLPLMLLVALWDWVVEAWRWRRGEPDDLPEL